MKIHNGSELCEVESIVFSATVPHLYIYIINSRLLLAKTFSQHGDNDKYGCDNFLINDPPKNKRLFL